MDPYRSGVAEQASGDASNDRGIVGDVIAQFADRFAFLRELVQNAIDAGSPDVAVRIAYDAVEARLAIAVVDRGEGMTRAIVEEQLLVLFRSTKEGARDKIGKFGIGFVSVLAPDPEVVVIQTAAREDGRRLEVHLERDLTYRVFDAGPTTRSGTTVTVELRVAADQVAGVVARSRDALVRWCRHATVPITLDASAAGGEVTRIDRPLALEDAEVVVEAREDELVVLVGASATQAPTIGFYNHGLTLLETTTDLARTGGAIVKIQDARLGHTLSRDDVRRDDAFAHAIAVARRLAREELPRAAAHAMTEAARCGDLATHGRIVEACLRAEVALAAWMFPLAVAHRGEPVADLAARTAAWASVREPVAWPRAGEPGELAALASVELDEPVFVCDDEAAFAGRVRRLGVRAVRYVERELTRAVPIEPTPRVAAVLAAIARILARAYRAPHEIVPVRIEGAHAGALALAGPRGKHVVASDEVAASVFGRLRRPVMWVDVTHPAFDARDPRPPAAIATLVARHVLLAARALDRECSATVLDETLALLEEPA